MSSATNIAPNDFQLDFGCTVAPTGLKLSGQFRILDNMSPAKNEEVCVSNGFPKFSDIFDLSALEHASAELKRDANSEPKLLTAQEALENFVENIVLNSDEKRILSGFNGIVRQAANNPLNASQVNSSVQRMIASAKQPVEFAKIVAVLNNRIKNSEFAHASVALQIENGKEVFFVMSRGETVLKAPLQS